MKNVDEEDAATLLMEMWATLLKKMRATLLKNCHISLRLTKDALSALSAHLRINISLWAVYCMFAQQLFVNWQEWRDGGKVHLWCRRRYGVYLVVYHASCTSTCTPHRPPLPLTPSTRPPASSGVRELAIGLCAKIAELRTELRSFVGELRRGRRVDGDVIGCGNVEYSNDRIDPEQTLGIQGTSPHLSHSSQSSSFQHNPRHSAHSSTFRHTPRKPRLNAA